MAIAAMVAVMAPIAYEADAQATGRSGKEVVDAVCAACHATGANGAPRIGDQKAWTPRASQGLTSLTQHAIKGIRQMPAHGGSPGVTDFEIELAITYMVNQSGGHWAEPINKAAPPAAERSGEQIVRTQCVKCHGSGVDGAPKIGDRSAWIPRARQGLDAVVRSAIKGHGGMPPRGGMADLTDPEIRSAIIYMFEQGVAPTKGSSAAPGAESGRDHKVVEGTEIYLGVVSAESLRAQQRKPGAESAMHGGIPSGKGYYHVNITLLDSKTKAVITDAEVKARVADPAMGGETKKLDLMAINNTLSYGNYFRVVGANPYTITVQITRPGTPQSFSAEFGFPR
ncbi:MAG: c-type cytochrome [Burkholderiales bacterium]